MHNIEAIDKVLIDDLSIKGCKPKHHKFLTPYKINYL